MHYLQAMHDPTKYLRNQFRISQNSACETCMPVAETVAFMRATHFLQKKELILFTKHRINLPIVDATLLGFERKLHIP